MKAAALQARKTPLFQLGSIIVLLVMLWNVADTSISAIKIGQCLWFMNAQDILIKCVRATHYNRNIKR